MIIVESSPVERIRHCLIGVPDVGLVGSIAVSYIIQSLNMREIGHLESDILPPVIVVHRGTPRNPFRVYANQELTAISSEIPIGSDGIGQLARCIVDWVKMKKVELLVSISGIAVQNRLQIDVPMIYGIGTSPDIRRLFEKAGIETFEEGFVAGIHALIMRECIKKKVPNVILLAQSHLQYPDPGAAVSMVKALNDLFDFKIDTNRLAEQTEEIRVKTRELMQRTQQSMKQMHKGQEQEIPMMYV